MQTVTTIDLDVAKSVSKSTALMPLAEFGIVAPVPGWQIKSGHDDGQIVVCGKGLKR
jgi:hypothetical protein